MVEDIWAVLGMAATDDLKQIKKAYALKLKQTRPDQDPERFQQLNQAYKQAQSWATIHSKTVKLSEIKSDSVESKQAQASIYIDSHQQQYQTELDSLMAQAEQLLKHQGKRNQLKAWFFIQESPLILHIDFRQQLGALLFSLVANHNIKNGSKRNKPLRINRLIVQHFDQLFDWHGQQSQFRQRFPNNQCQAIFRHLGHHLTDTEQFKGVRGGMIKADEPGKHKVKADNLTLEDSDLIWKLCVVAMFVAALFVE